MNPTLRNTSLLTLAAALLLAVPSAQADFIGDSDGNTVTATANAAESYAGAANMVNGSLMSDSPVVKTSTNTNTWWSGSWITHVSSNANYNTGWLLFTFTKNTSLKEMVIWNLLSEETSAAYGRGMRAVTITYSTGSDASGVSGGTIFSGDLKQATWTGVYNEHTAANGWGYTDDFNFTEAQNVKAVKITYTSNYGGDGTGLSEVRFVGTPTYTVTYDANGGTGAPAAQSKIQGVDLTLSSGGGMTQTGYAFTGWNTVANGSGGDAYAAGGTYTVDADVTLYAQWTAVPTYTVTYDANGGTGAPAAQTKTQGVDLTLSSGGGMANTGYTFAGWNTLSGGGGTFYNAGGTYTADAAVTLYAQWTVVPTYTVTYDANTADSGSVPTDSGTYLSGSPVTVLGNTGSLVKTGYTFAGWNTAALGGGTSYAPTATFNIGANTTLYAQWAINFIGDSDGNTVTATAEYSLSNSLPISMVDGSKMSDSPVLKTSCNMNTNWTGSWMTHTSVDPHPATGWLLFTFTKNTSLKEMVIWNLLSEETNAAYWRGMKTVTITYSTGSDASGVSGGTIFSGDLKQATWTGVYNEHTAANGWGYTDDFNFTEVQNVKAVKITYTSNYGGDGTGLSEVRFVGTPTYTVTYDANGGTGAPAAQGKIQGVDLTLSSGGGMTQTGYAFTGWNTAPDGTGTPYAASGIYTADADVTLYAQWTAVPTYTVTYSANGGTGAPAAQTKTQGVDLTLSSDGGMANTGYTFAGWDTLSGGGGTFYNAGATYTADAAVTLYAQWTEVPTYTVTYDANTADSGSVPTDSGTHLSGSPVTVLGNTGSLVKTGYTFAGWNTAALGGGTSYAPAATFNIGANTTLYAQWAINFIGDYDGNSVIATSPVPSVNGSAPARLVDGSGMLPTGPVMKTSKNLGEYWLTQWITESPNSGSVKFTFTNNTSLKEMLIWNLGDNEGGPWAINRGLKAVTITYSTGTDDSGSGGGTIHAGDLAQCPGNPMPVGGYSYQNDLTFPEVANVKAVQITWTSNWGGDSAGLSEVRFVGTPVGPIDHYEVSAATPQTVGTAFDVTVTAKDGGGNTVTTDNTTLVTMSGNGNVQFDSDGNGTYGDNTKTLTAGTFTIKAKDNTAESVTLTATDGNTKTGYIAGVVIQTPYQAWLNGATPTDANLKEFALGTPNTGVLVLDVDGKIATRGQAPIIQTTVGSAAVKLTYARLKNSGCTCSAEFSNNLGVWLPSTDPSLIYPPDVPTEVIVDNGDDMEVVSVKFPIFRDNGGTYVKMQQDFCRIAVTTH